MTSLCVKIRHMRFALTLIITRPFEDSRLAKSSNKQIFFYISMIWSLPLETSLSLGSGDSSVVTRWTVDQEVVGSNPTHGRK